MNYISIDGDDVGRKITSLYLSNNEIELHKFSVCLNKITKNISKLLKSQGFKVIFCAADGVVASTENVIDFIKIFDSIKQLSTIDITFSAGVGNNLYEAYIALIAAKSNGKNCLYNFSEIKPEINS